MTKAGRPILAVLVHGTVGLAAWPILASLVHASVGLIFANLFAHSASVESPVFPD
jgi:hypothetical protein